MEYEIAAVFQRVDPFVEGDETHWAPADVLGDLDEFPNGASRCSSN